MFARHDQRGNQYLFSKASHTFDSSWSEKTDTTVTSDEFRTVAYAPLEREEGVSFGRGHSENPDKAEGYKWMQVHDGGDALIPGEYKLVVENAAGKVVALIDRGRTDEINQGDPDTDDRGVWGLPFPYVSLGPNGEILGGQGHRIALRVEADSGTATFSLANSAARLEGHKGDLQN